MQSIPACRHARLTRTTFLPRIAISLSLLGAGLLSGCSGTSDDLRPAEAPPEELTDGSKPAVDMPEAELVSDGKRYFESGLYSVAKDSFEKLRDGYPLGAYAEFAAIKVADCEFEASNFAIAASLYEDFLKNRPASPSTAYVLLRAARSNHLANRGVGRDDATLRRASELYQQLLTQFPSSPFSEGARTLLQHTQDILAANEKLVVDFYERKQQEPAAQARKRDFASRFGRDVELVEIEKEPAPLLESIAAAPVGSQVLFETSLGKGGETNDSPISSRARARQASGKISSPPAPRGTSPGRETLVRMVECDRAQRLVFLHLNQPVTHSGSVERLGPLNGSTSGFTFSVEGLTTPGAQTLERDCFTNRDVVISPTGAVSIKAHGASAQLMELSDPPRILVAIDQ